MDVHTNFPQYHPWLSPMMCEVVTYGIVVGFLLLLVIAVVTIATEQ